MSTIALITQAEVHTICQKRVQKQEYVTTCIGNYFNYSAYLFLTLSSYLLAAICCTRLSNKTWVYSRHLYADFTIVKVQRLFGAHLLARSVNMHQRDTSGSPFHFKGVCKGMGFWFLYLCLKTKPYFQNPIEHLQQVGAQFERGANPQAALLQSMTEVAAYELLGIHVENTFEIQTPSLSRRLSEMAEGYYSIYTSHHHFLFIKESQEQFIFDPEYGTVHAPTADILEKALNISLSGHHFSDPLYVDRYAS